MEDKQYCKSYGLSCYQCHYEKCIDSRGKYTVPEKEMDINIGDAVLFRNFIACKLDLGIVREVVTVTESERADRLTRKEYRVDVLKEGMKLITITKELIRCVFERKYFNEEV